MGTRGPMPKRPDLRQRRNKEPEGTVAAPVSLESSFTGTAFVQPNPAWTSKVRQLWDAAMVSAHTQMYEPTDWATLYAALEDYNAYQPKPTAGVMKETYAILGELLFTEGSRRRVSVTINRDNDEEARSAGLLEVDKWVEAFNQASVEVHGQ